MSKVDKTPGYFCIVENNDVKLKTGVMKEFLLNAMGYATIVAMIISIIYTWVRIDAEVKKMEKAG